jgi:hypothetical protein
MYGMNSTDARMGVLIKAAIHKKVKTLLSDCTGELKPCSGHWASCPDHAAIYHDVVGIVNESKEFVHPNEYNTVEVVDDNKTATNSSMRRSSSTLYRTYSLISLAVSRFLPDLTRAVLSAFECDFSLDIGDNSVADFIAEKGVTADSVAVYRLTRDYNAKYIRHIRHEHQRLRKASRENLRQTELDADMHHGLHGTEQKKQSQ